MHFFINTVSREHVQRGVAGGFTQADHGRDTRIKRLTKGDRIVFYSPRTEIDGGEPLQRFTAIGEVIDDAPYRVEIAPEFKPWRRRVTFVGCAEVPIQPLIEQLDFIRNKKSWGFTFRRGFFEIAESDFRKIEQAMCGAAAETSASLA
jgi:EVE domain-containing protein